MPFCTLPTAQIFVIVISVVVPGGHLITMIATVATMETWSSPNDLQDCDSSGLMAVKQHHAYWNSGAMATRILPSHSWTVTFFSPVHTCHGY